MSVLGEGFIRIRPIGDTFEAEAKKEVEASLKGLSTTTSKVAADAEKSFAKAGQSVKGVTSELDKAATKSGSFLSGIKNFASNLFGGGQATVFTDLLQKNLKGLAGQSGTLGNVTKDLIGTFGKGADAAAEEGAAAEGATGGLLGMGAATAGIGLAVAATVGFLAKGVQAFASSTEQVRKFQLVAGGTAQADSKLVATLNALGVAPETAARGFFLLSKNLDANRSKFDALGISVARNKDGTIDLNQTLLNVSDTYNKTKDQAKKNEIAFTAFGRSGLALIPVLAAGKDQLAALNAEAAKKGLEFSQQDLDRGHQFTIETRSLGQSVKGLEIAAAEELVPALIKWLQYMTSIFELGTKTIHMIDSQIESIKKLPGVGQAFAVVSSLLDRVVGSSGNAAAALDVQAQASQDAAAAADALTKAEQSVSTASGSLIDKSFAVADAQKALRDLNQQIADQGQVITRAEEDQTAAKTELSKAQKTYDALLKVGGADLVAYKKATDDVRNAEQSLADARNGVLDAMDAVAQKQYDLNVAIGEYGPLSQQAMKAQTDLRDANNNVGKANNDVLNSQEAVTQAQQDQKDAAAGSKASDDRLAKARADLTTATRTEQDAEKKLRDERQKTTDQSADLEKAYFTLGKTQADQRETELLAAGATQDSIDKNQILKTKLDQIATALDPSNPFRVNLKNYTQDLLDNAAAAQAAAGFIAGTPSSVVISPTAPKPANINPIAQGLIAPLGLPHKAGGGQASGWQMVGESGPELAYFGGGGGYVQDARATSRSAGSGNEALVAAIIKLVETMGRPNVNLGGLTNVQVDPHALVQRIAFEQTAPVAAP